MKSWSDAHPGHLPIMILVEAEEDILPPVLDGDPADAAFVEQNDPRQDPGLIPGLVQTGYIVRTRADADTEQARSGDTADRDAALASGAQYVSTDYPIPDPVFGTGYFVAIPDGAPGRCNPVNAPIGCRPAAIERPF